MVKDLGMTVNTHHNNNTTNSTKLFNLVLTVALFRHRVVMMIHDAGLIMTGS